MSHHLSGVKEPYAFFFFNFTSLELRNQLEISWFVKRNHVPRYCQKTARHTAMVLNL